MATSRIERLMAKRAAERRVRALHCALTAMPALNEQGIKAYVIGSLATGQFMSHSDVDYLVIGQIAPMERRLVEATIARTMAGSNVGYDVVYEEDITRSWRGLSRKSPICVTSFGLWPRPRKNSLLLGGQQ